MTTSNETHERLGRSVRAFCGAAVAAVGLVGLVGWWADVPLLTSVVPGFATMKANTAGLFVLAGASLLATTRGARPGRGARAVGPATAAAVLAVAVLSLAQDAFSVDLRIDQLLVPAAPGATPPGRMAVVTAGVFALLGSGLLLLHAGVAARVRQGVGVAALMVSALICLSYLYGPDALGDVWGFSAVAVHTAAGLALVSAGVLAAPGSGVIRLAADAGVGGTLVRRLLPAALLVPALAGWLRLEGQRAGWYGLEFGLALFALSNVTLFTALALWTAFRVEAANAQRRAAAGALGESERRSRLLLEGVPQLVWTCRSDGWCDYLSRQWVEYTGVPEAEHLGYGWSEAVHPDDRPALLERWRGTVETGAPLDVEFRIRSGSGEYRWFKTRAVHFREPGGGGRWLGTNTDIHDKKRAEERLRELNATLEQRVAERTAALQASEQKFRAIFDAQFQFIGLLSPAGVLLEANRTALRAAGVSEAEVIGRPFWETVWWAHDAAQRERLREAVVRAAAGRADRFEASHPAADGSLLWVDFTLTPFHDDQGRVVFLIPEGRDVTERKRAEAALRASEERYRLATTAAHVGVWEWNVVTNRIHWNDQMFRMYQVPPTADGVVPYEAWSGAVLPEDLPREEEILRQTVETLGSSARSFRIRLPGGACRYIEAAERVLTDARGRAEWVVGTNLDVTDRHLAEEALRESEALLRSFFEAPGGLRGVVELIDGDIVHLRDNAESAAFFGLTQDELKNRRASQMGVTAAAIRVWTEHYRECERLGHPVRFEFPVPQTEQWLTASVSALPSTGAAKRFAYVAWDVTDRKRAERALRESEERFRSAFESAPIGMALVGTEGRWLQVNHSLCELVGYDERELLATDFQAVTHPDDLEADLGYGREMLAGAIRTYQLEKRYFHKTGNVVHALLSVSLVRDAAGAPLYFIAQIMDITQRKQAERALAANDALLRQFIKHSPAAIAMLDREVRYLQASDRWLTDYALLGRDIIGRSHYDVFPDIPERWRAVHRRVLAGATERCAEDPFERADGSTVWLQWECQPWHDATGGVAGLIMFTQVVTDRKLAEEKVRASLREKEVLLKEIHHRVKNNLQIVSALLDLQSEHTSDPGVVAMFAESRGRVKSMALIHERLYRSHDLARVNFTEYVRQLADDLYRTYKVSDGIRFDLSVDVPPLPLDVAIPCGLLLNELMSNCFKHAFRGADGGCVRVALYRDGAASVLSVADDGSGFPPGVDFRATGSFGMQLVNTLVDQLDGAIDLVSGRGTVVTVRFPRSQP